MATQLFGLLGWPVHHSVSPAMMNAAFADLGIDAHYFPFAVQPQRLSDALAGLSALNTVGVNVTIPHKQAVFHACTVLTREAELAKAVNTLKFQIAATEEMERADASENLPLLGHNTDVTGWWSGVSDKYTNAVRTVVVLGAGGAARAVIAALALYASAVRVRVIARNRGSASALAQEFAPLIQVEPFPWESRNAVMHAADWIVQCTPIGMWPNVDDSPIDDEACFHTGQFVQDLIYRPSPTRFLMQAKSRGCVTADGLEMLVQQGARALEWWTGVQAPTEVMRAAARNAVYGNGFETNK